MSRYDALLRWVSERGSVPWRSFRAGCEDLGLRAGRALSLLSQLGHAEVDWDASLVAVCSPTAVSLADLPERYLLCGARPSGFLAELERLVQEHELDVELDAPRAQPGEGPSILLVEASDSGMRTLSEAAGLKLELAAAGRLAALLPKLTLEAVGERVAPAARYPRVPLDRLTLKPRWDLSASSDDGVWQVVEPAGRCRYLRQDGHWWRIPTWESAPYLAGLPDELDPPVWYEQATEVLHVDTRAPLPPLHARAACLCTGCGPIAAGYAPGVTVEAYVGVAEQVARQIAESLGTAA